MNGKTLTAEQCSKLSLYILMTTKTREGEAEAWEKLAEEKREDGSPKYIHAADRSGIARYGGSASRRRRQRNERRFFPYLRGVRARCYGAVGERHYLLSVLCSRQMQGARRWRETL